MDKALTFFCHSTYTRVFERTNFSQAYIHISCVFLPAFGCCTYPKDGQNTFLYLISAFLYNSFLFFVWKEEKKMWTIGLRLVSTQMGSIPWRGYPIFFGLFLTLSKFWCCLEIDVTISTILMWFISNSCIGLNPDSFFTSTYTRVSNFVPNLSFRISIQLIRVATYTRVCRKHWVFSIEYSWVDH